MKKRLFNIHKLIGVNVLLFFFISLFFGIITIFQPYISFWEDSNKHISHINIEDIDLNRCVEQVNKRTYFGEDGKKVTNDLIKFNLPSKQTKATNLIRVVNRPHFYLDPHTCKKIRGKSFEISQFFDKIHTGKIFNSIIFKILFGFMSVAIVFLSLSGLFLIIKNNYRNGKTKSLKGFYAKYHRLLFLYTLPIVFMFGLTGALFNLGVYSSPLITKYLTNGETANILKVERNILVDKDLKIETPSKKVKTLNLSSLYFEAKKQFDNVSFYAMHVYNYNDINSKVKFIGYEPDKLFISSMTNESYVVLSGTTAEVLDKKVASQGSFVEKTLDSIFFLHYLRTFMDIPRVLFSLICFMFLIGLIYAMTLWLERAKKDKFTFKVLKPLSFTIILGSVVSFATLLASNWSLPNNFVSFSLNNKLYFTQEVFFYMVFVFVFLMIYIQKDLFKTTKLSLYISSFLMVFAVICHNIYSGFTLITLYKENLLEIFFTDIAFIVFAFIFFILAFKLKKEQFSFDKK
ncbi:PepSY domain-containing protein [Campylobacterota bacterium DY0563]